jgi:hypothetical protein
VGSGRVAEADQIVRYRIGDYLGGTAIGAFHAGQQDASEGDVANEIEPSPLQPVMLTSPRMPLSSTGKLTYGVSSSPGPPPMEIKLPQIVSPSRRSARG